MDVSQFAFGAFGHETEGMVSPLTVSPLTTYRVYESYGFAFLFSFFLFATCLDSSNLIDIPLFCQAFVPVYFVRILFS